ncbi:hypothetical protein ACOMHN_046529 [Nucella lapillus]
MIEASAVMENLINSAQDEPLAKRHSEIAQGADIEGDLRGFFGDALHLGVFMGSTAINSCGSWIGDNEAPGPRMTSCSELAAIHQVASGPFDQEVPLPCTSGPHFRLDLARWPVNSFVSSAACEEGCPSVSHPHPISPNPSPFVVVVVDDHKGHIKSRCRSPFDHTAKV